MEGPSSEFQCRLFLTPETGVEGTVSFHAEDFVFESKEDGKRIVHTLKSVALHALTRSSEAFLHPCVYIQIYKEMTGDENDVTAELRFVVEDEKLQALYDAVCEGVRRNPDSIDDDDGDSGGDMAFDIPISMEIQQEDEPGQFDDA